MGYDPAMFVPVVEWSQQRTPAAEQLRPGGQSKLEAAK